MKKYINYFFYIGVLPFLCGIIVGMSVETWGLMPKSGVDNETIEQAIARLITVHNDDNQSHLLVGQSIDEHRKESVIDHPAGSVLGDKYTNQEFTLTPTFESPDIYTKSSTGIVYSLGGLRFQTLTTANTVKYLRASGQYSPRYYKETQDTTFQFNARFTNTATYIAYGVAGNTGELEVPAGIGFKFVNDAVYAAQIYSDAIGETAEILTLISGISSADRHQYRVQLSVAEDLIRYYVDGTEYHSEAISASTDYGLALFEFYVKNTNALNKYGYFSGVYLSINTI